jgi:RND family efflux transporter MFP subunit
MRRLSMLAILLAVAAIFGILAPDTSSMSWTRDAISQAKQGSSQARQGPGDGQRPPAPAVEVTSAVEKDVAPTSVILGSCEPRRTSVVAASIEGYVIENLVREGQSVEAGAVLARMRQRELELQLASAKNELEEVKEQHRRAQLDLERAQKLIAKEAATQKALDDALVAERILALQIPQAEARAELLALDLAKKTVTAPFRGEIVSEHTEVGEWLIRGGSVATIVDLEVIRVRAGVPEALIRFLEKGSRISVAIPGAKESPYSGAIASISAQGDPISRTFSVLIEIENDGKIRAGMSGRIEVPSALPHRGVVVPKDAIIVRGGQSFVFVVASGAEGDVAELRTVRVGSAAGGDFAIESGVAPGDRVVVRGNERIQPGQPVKVLPGSPSSTTGGGDDRTQRP